MLNLGQQVVRTSHDFLLAGLDKVKQKFVGFLGESHFGEMCVLLLELRRRRADSEIFMESMIYQLNPDFR